MNAAQGTDPLAAVTDWWQTSISDIEPGVIRLRGYPIEQLIAEISLPEMVWLLLRGDLPTRGQARLLEAALVAAVDHGPQAPSIAAARMAATCGVGLNNAVATGVNLLGDIHGGAGQQCMRLLAELCRRLDKGEQLDAVVTESLAEHRAKHSYLPGFGHRFHPRDPRRDPLLDLLADAAEDGTVSGRYLQIICELERQLGRDRPRPVPVNIDGATATVYCELGFPAELGRGLFVLSRSVGILAHAWEESQDGRRIKGPIPPPLLPTYAGHPPRDLSPVRRWRDSTERTADHA
ncbi:citryl-CoA lyase [Streptomyces sp. 7N604]|uniref:citryl-CoA lyase n=1 Tax=Streptomyces sp. 7N604 TaxID=3457415 RepID=UPI003FD629A8